MLYHWKRILYILAVCAQVHATNREELKKPSREKRSLLYGPFGVLQLILGLGTPIPDFLNPALTMGFFMRGIYAMPKNASDYTNPNITELTRSLSVTRWDIYEALEKDSEVRGHGGRTCVLRAICEAADTPLDKYHGFFEEVFHAIFTPSSSKDQIRNHSDNEYLAAHDLGRTTKGVCKHLFPNCKVTFLDLFTQLFGSFNND